MRPITFTKISAAVLVVFGILLGIYIAKFRNKYYEGA